MRHTSKAQFLAVFLSVAAALLAGNRLFAADQAASAPARPGSNAWHPARGMPTPQRPPAAGNPDPQATAATLAKLKDLGGHLSRALDLAVELFSGNEAELFSKNNTALLSGNSPKVLTGKNPRVLSGNTTSLFSGNTLSVLSNIKVEIHIDNAGNTNTTGGATAQPALGRMVPSLTEPQRGTISPRQR
jgi:hypothetical protein